MTMMIHAIDMGASQATLALVTLEWWDLCAASQVALALARSQEQVASQALLTLVMLEWCYL